MNLRMTIVLLISTLAACSREEPAPAAAPMKPRPQAAPVATTAETPAPVPVPVPVPAPVAERPAPPALPAPPPYVPPALKKSDVPPALIQSASFTFRTMDHLKADVLVNGEKMSETSCLWTLTANTEFDPKIPVTSWPPEGARYCGAGVRKDEEGVPVSSVEVWIEGGWEPEKLRARFPHLAPGEHALYVKGSLGGLQRIGALRVKVVGRTGTLYRHTDYDPVTSEEAENRSRFLRSLWFEPVEPPPAKEQD